jgi:hypothetical protein
MATQWGPRRLVVLASALAVPALLASAAAAGAPPAAGRSAAAAATTTGQSSWPTYHHDGERTGVQSMPAASTLTIAWRATLDGAVYASPVLANGGVIAATENDTVYYLRSGSVVWKHHLGAAVQSGTSCPGTIHPLGITSTPVYAPATNTVYVAAELAAPIRHVLYALDAATGGIRWSKRIDPTGSDPAAQLQRPALALSGGNVYAEMGSIGDCGDYHGWVIGVPANGSGSPFWYRTPGTAGGIWSPPGPVTDASGQLLTSVGNGGATSAGQPYDFSDSVLRLSSGLARLDYFAPAVWADDNARDLDLGSNAPARVHLSSGTFVVIAGKRGVAYLLHDPQLGGIGGQIASLAGCAAYGGDAVVGSVAYLPCSDGVRAVQVTATGLTFRWHAAPAGSPVVGGGLVWTIDAKAGVLYGLSPSTGAVVRTISVGATSRFATPALQYDGHILVPTLTGVVSVAGG